MTRSYPVDEPNTPLDTAVEVLMAAMLLFLPLAFGGNQPWAQEVWFMIVAAAGVCTLLRRVIDPGFASVRTWAYLPIAVFVGLVLLQQVPLPRGLLGAMSPGTLRLRDPLFTGSALPDATPISFYALAGMRQTRLLLAVAAVFVIVLRVYRTPERRGRLLVTIVTVGLVVSVVTVYQNVTNAKLILGTLPVGQPKSGPFLNHSQFGQFMNLCAGAAVAWLLMTLADWTDGWRSGERLADEVRRPQNAFAWAALVLLVAVPMLIFAAMSRMGVLSMLAAGGTMAALIGWRGRMPSRDGVGRRTNRPGRSGTGRRGRAVFLVVTYGIVVLTIALAFGFDTVFDRLATLHERPETSVGVRHKIIEDLLPLWKQLPLFGAGLGTHEFVFPMFNRQDLAVLFTHAENEYAQLMEETGLVGVACAAAFLAVVAVAFVRCVRSPRRPEQFAAFGLGFGLLAILIHSSSDFGQHLPANAVLTAIFCALLVLIAAHDRPAVPSDAGATAAAGRAERFGPGLALAIFGVIAAYVCFAADAERRAAAAWNDTRQQSEDVAGSSDPAATLTDAVSRSARAEDLVPDDVVYRYGLNALRWRQIAQKAFDPQTGNLTLNADDVEATRQLVGDLDAVRELCPTFGPPLGLAAQLKQQVLGQSGTEAQIELAYRLTPHDRDLCRLAGGLAVARQQWDTARAVFDRYTRLGGSRRTVVNTYLTANRPDLAQAAAAGDRANLKQLGDDLAKYWPGEAERAAACHAESDALLRTQSESADSGPAVWVERAQYEEANARPAAAAEWYAKAVESDYGRVDWRLQLAKALAASGRRAEAAQHLQICLRLRPNQPDLEKLLAEYKSTRGRDTNVTP